MKFTRLAVCLAIASTVAAKRVTRPKRGGGDIIAPAIDDEPIFEPEAEVVDHGVVAPEPEIEEEENFSDYDYEEYDEVPGEIVVPEDEDTPEYIEEIEEDQLIPASED